MKKDSKMPNFYDKSIVVENVFVGDQLIPINMHYINVGGEIGRRINVTIQKNLLAIDIDSHFLRPFIKKEHRPYVGLGKLIDAAVHFAVYTEDKRVIALKNHVISETIKTQLPDGYIGTMGPKDRMRKDYDIHEMAYIIYGLVGDYCHYGNKPSLDAAKRLADYIIEKWTTRETGLTTLGMAEGFMALYKETSQQRYLDFCTSMKMGRLGNMALRDWKHPVRGHVYRYLARSMMQLYLYRIEPSETLLTQTQQALDFLTTRDGLVITGTCSHGEAWHNDQKGSGHLGETCATAYLIRLLDNIMRLKGDMRYGDIMERSILNALFAAQSPDGQHIRYFTPFEGKRAYFENENIIELPSYDTYCCPNNFRRIIAELPTKIYYQSGGGVAINLYTLSTAMIELAGGVTLSVRQDTDYPNSGHVVVHLTPSKPATFPVRLRIPRWCSQACIAVNGKPMNKPAVGRRCFEIIREWEPGDRITLNMPMQWRIIEGRKMQKGRIAVMRGPIVYCLVPERNNRLSGVDLRKITIDPASLSNPTKDDAVRPDGLKCRVRAWSGGRNFNQPTDLDLLLTEFPDPTGEATYFFVPTKDIALHDELAEALQICSDYKNILNQGGY